MKNNICCIVGLILTAFAISCPAQVISQKSNTLSARANHSDEGRNLTSESVLMKTVTLNVVNMPLEDVIRTIAEQANIPISYSDAVLPTHKPITVALVDATIAEAFSAVLRDTDVQLSVGSTGQVMLIPSPRSQQETGTIKGKVRDAITKQPLPGANVKIEGTRYGAMARADGNFTINEVLPGTYKLYVSILGYGSTWQEVTVAAGKVVTIDFLLEEKAIGLGEVVVTAQKRSEQLRDVPVPLAVVSATSLQQNNQVRLREYCESVPGFVVSPTPTGGNQQVLAIRGITAGIGGNPTVGITVDDVPYGAFTREFGVDIDPSDLVQVELLRGPQGTLYGSNSMGGVLKYTTVDPSTDNFRGQVQVGTSSVYNGAQPGYNFRGAVNVPITNNLAVRMSAFTRQDPGYIDNYTLGTKGVNEDHANGGRLSALLQLSDQWSLKVTGLYQDIKYDGLGEVDVPTAGYPMTTGVGDLQQNYILGVGGSDQKTQAYSAVLKGKLGNVDLTSVTGYNVYQVNTSNDYSYLQRAAAERLFGVSGAQQFTGDIVRKVTEEIRASIPIGQSLEWLVGGFYTHENNPLDQGYNAEDTVTGRKVGTFSILHIPIRFTEYAIFTDLTVHFTDRFDVQFGGRESFLNLNFDPVTSTSVAGATPAVLAGITSSPDVFTFLITPRFKVSSDLMVYGRVASGYRPNRANSFNPDPAVPRTANPDKTQNYEIGVKGGVLEDDLTFDGSLYHIDWKDIQILLLDPNVNLSFITNGSAAKSEGAELSLTARPLTGLTIAASGSYDNAVLTEDLPVHTTAYGPKGSRLPFSARWSGNLSMDQSFSVTNNIIGLVGLTLDYIGDRIGTFVATPQRAFYPEYSKVDLRAGAKFELWSIDLYAKNVGDRRALLGGGPGTLPPFAYYYIQPRTFGISIVRTL